MSILYFWMSGDRFLTIMMGFLVLGVFVFAFIIVGFDVGLTGYAFFADNYGSDFDGGVYNATEWNGTAVVLGILNDSEREISEDGDIVLLMHMNDDIGPVRDDSSNGNDGNYNGDSYSFEGKLNDAIGFDGSNDYIEINHSDSLSLNNSYSIQLWLNPSSGVAQWRTFLEKSGQFRMDLINGDLIRFQASGYTNLDSSVPVDRGSWNHILVTLDNSASGNDYIRIYINGQLSGTVGPTWGTPGTDTSSVYLGAPSSLSNFFESSMDEVVFWNRALTSSEVLDIYNKQSSGYVSSGSFESRVFDSGADAGAVWNNITISPATGLGLSFDAMNCSVADCSDGLWQNIVLDSVNLTGKYFKYKAYFLNSSVFLTNVSVDYTLLNSAPVVTLVSPENVVYDYNSSLALNYSFFDSEGNSESCWYSLDSGGAVALAGCLNVTFDIGDGTHNLTVYVNDSFGEVGMDFVEFGVDVLGINIDLAEPIGKKNSRSGIPIVYSEVGADKCWYNVETSIGGNVIENTSLPGCESSFFNVSSDGDYVLNLFANNSFGTLDSDSSSFSIDTSVVAPPVDDGGSSGGGGGGGGSFSSVSSLDSLEIEPISVVASIGEDKNLLARVKNVGKVAANKCFLSDSEYVDSDDIMNIAAGEIVEFMFVLSVSDFGVEDLNLSVVCLDNVSESVPLTISILNPDLDVSISGISFNDDGKLLVKYSVESSDSSSFVLNFNILNSDGGVVADNVSEVNLVPGESYDGEVLIDLLDAEKGMLRVSVSDEDDKKLVEEDFVYGGGSAVTGFALLGEGGGINYIGISVFFLLVLIGVLGWRAWKLYRK